jgi:FixJ family two-component response regulator
MNEGAVVHVVDDDADVRESLSMLLGSVGIRVLRYTNASDFLSHYKPHPGAPGCILLDVRMPGISGMTLLERLRDEQIPLPVIMLTGHGDIPMSVRAMKLGAVDFITKPFHHQRLLDLVQGVLRDDSRRSRGDAPAMDPAVARERWASLTSREREVFDGIVAGASNKVIAGDLGISVRTVETHRARIMDKLQARSLVDLVLLSLSLREPG